MVRRMRRTWGYLDILVNDKITYELYEEKRTRPCRLHPARTGFRQLDGPVVHTHGEPKYLYTENNENPRRSQRWTRPQGPLCDRKLRG